MRRQFKGLRPEFLRCRTLGHTWENVDTGVWQHRWEYLSGYRETLQCPTCTTLREEVWSDASGELLCRYYKYPKGYSLADVEVPPGITLRELMRVEWSARAKAGAVRRARQRAVELKPVARPRAKRQPVGASR